MSGINLSLVGPSLTITKDVGGDLVSSTATAAGRAMTANSYTSGVRFFELGIEASTGPYSFGVVRSSSNLSNWIGQVSDETGFWLRNSSMFQRWTSGSLGANYGLSQGLIGCRIYFWVNCSNGNVWVTTSDHTSGRFNGSNPTSSPATDSVPLWTIPGSDPLRIAVNPYAGGTSIRVYTRHHQLSTSIAERMGALPWDARTATITFQLKTADGSDVATGTSVNWVWFDNIRPDQIVEPTSKGTTTIGAEGTFSVNVSTSLDSGGVGWILVSDSDGTVSNCRTHAMPVTLP